MTEHGYKRLLRDSMPARTDWVLQALRPLKAVVGAFGSSAASCKSYALCCYHGKST